MSSDFTSGKNKKITKESVYIMLSENLGKLFFQLTSNNNGLNNDCFNKNYFYNYFLENGKFNVDEEYPNSLSSRWDLYSRYRNSNNYSNNKFDDVIILNAAAESKLIDDLLDKKDDTINERRKIILDECNELIKNGICSNFTLSSFFPHLDKPNSISDIKSVSGDIPCFEYGYTTIYAEINYTDSCGQNLIEPDPLYNEFIVKYYPSSTIMNDENINEYPFGVMEITNEKFKYNTLNDEQKPSSSFNWKIIENSQDVMVMNNEYSEPTIDIATLSSAINQSITLNLTYIE